MVTLYLLLNCVTLRAASSRAISLIGFNSFKIAPYKQAKDIIYRLLVLITICTYFDLSSHTITIYPLKNACGKQECG